MIKTLSLLFFATIVFSCKKDVKECQNLLKGRIYHEISEIPELKGYEFQAGSMIDYEEKSSDEYRFCVSQYFNKRNYLLILEEKEGGKSNHISSKIIDTIMIANVKSDEIISLCTCRINGINDSRIIAVVKENDDDKEYLNNVVKAWKADLKKEKLIPIKNLKEIDCINEGYGL